MRQEAAFFVCEINVSDNIFLHCSQVRRDGNIIEFIDNTNVVDLQDVGVHVTGRHRCPRWCFCTTRFMWPSLSAARERSDTDSLTVISPPGSRWFMSTASCAPHSRPETDWLPAVLRCLASLLSLQQPPLLQAGDNTSSLELIITHCPPEWYRDTKYNLYETIINKMLACLSPLPAAGPGGPAPAVREWHSFTDIGHHSLLSWYQYPRHKLVGEIINKCSVNFGLKLFQSFKQIQGVPKQVMVCLKDYRSGVRRKHKNIGTSISKHIEPLTQILQELCVTVCNKCNLNLMS